MDASIPTPRSWPKGPGGPAGVILSSHLSRTNGHVCQVSVSPEAQARGLGEVLMTSALAAFRQEGLDTASLSVTYDNRRAYRLYERLGFRLAQGVRRPRLGAASRAHRAPRLNPSVSPGPQK